MPTIFIKDDLRAAVEAASGGQQTVLYTAKGQPSYMNVVPRFNLEDVGANLGSGVHPAFVVDGVEKTEFFYGSYAGIIKNGELLSLPNVVTYRGVGFDTVNSAARACGAGWHVSTNAEWAALMLWCSKNGFTPRGNTGWGRSHESTFETGRRADGKAPGDFSSEGLVLNGSGPASWRHNNTSNGISDLVGNTWEWQSGARIVDGEIQVLPNNNAASATADLSSASTAWRAIRLSDGALVAPGTAGTAKLDSPTATTTGDGGLPKIVTAITNFNGPAGSSEQGAGQASGIFNSMTPDAGVTIPAILRALGLFPHVDTTDGDLIYVRNYGERNMYRGGWWANGVPSGMRSLAFFGPRTYANANLGARPAFVL